MKKIFLIVLTLITLNNAYSSESKESNNLYDLERQTYFISFNTVKRYPEFRELLWQHGIDERNFINFRLGDGIARPIFVHFIKDEIIYLANFTLIQEYRKHIWNPAFSKTFIADHYQVNFDNEAMDLSKRFPAIFNFDDGTLKLFKEYSYMYELNEIFIKYGITLRNIIKIYELDIKGKVITRFHFTDGNQFKDSTEGHSIMVIFDQTTQKYIEYAENDEKNENHNSSWCVIL